MRFWNAPQLGNKPSPVVLLTTKFYHKASLAHNELTGYEINSPDSILKGGIFNQL